MARRTATLQLLPWRGTLVTSVDELLLQPGQLTIADNVSFSYNHEKRRREGINYDWDGHKSIIEERESTSFTRTLRGDFSDSGIVIGDRISISDAPSAYNGSLLEVTDVGADFVEYTALTELEEVVTPETGAYLSNLVVGGIDFWFGSEDAKAQYLVYVLDNGAVYYSAAGATTRLPDIGTPWTLPLTEANLEVFQNRVIIAVSGLNNRMKHWNGDPTESLNDLPANLLVTSVERSSAGTTRTLKFSEPVDLPIGAEILINGGPADYNGKWVIATNDDVDTITYEATTPLTEAATEDLDITVGTAAPLASFLRSHAGSLWTNDKTRLDRLHYSGQSAFEWGGIGVSGATDIGEGDGDPNGLTGIAPPFKGVLFVGKRTKLYRVDLSMNSWGAYDPDTSTITQVSNGIGFISHQGITAIDQDDIFFASDRGFHSLAATDAYGDFTASFISADIQKTFVENFTQARKKYIKAAYLPQINSAIFAVSEDGSARNNSLYLFNIELKGWYRWPNVDAETLISAQDSDKRRVYLGTTHGRLAQTMTGGNIDFSHSGQVTTIQNRVATGFIMPDSRPDTIKGFKNIRVVYRSQGSFTITAKFQIDNYSEQAVAFISNEQAVPLGQFVLGEDVLGGSYVTAPYSLPVDGYGRAFKLTIEQNDLNTTLAIQGFLVEYWGGEQEEETRQGDEG